ncbi:MULTISPECIES: hypothetical protein [Methanobacterium]|jgi:hypothetical protein|uniref:Uncharacterized protein n=1 Tax=Methanobacterium veterum TaxID=408577 RepID=A0A9E5DGB8_9EURY|nr:MULTISPECIES: hypothetical protein [Methanobacterium]MCZ3364406.1 hypothetical protein [Methanobacterium veterum]MCZ3372157.1 hypothetical protein [Methanobacterium veterum]
MQRRGFISLLLDSFFRWWWALITGLASLISLFILPDNIMINQAYFSILIIIISVLLFLCASTLYQGLSLYQNRLSAPKVIGSLNSKIYGGDIVFLIESSSIIIPGKIAEFRRFHNGVEVSFALVEFMEENSKGQLQAKPLWISPAHLHDFKLQKFSTSDITVDLLIQSRTLSDAKDSL